MNCFDTYEHRVDLLHNYFKSTGANVRVITSDYRHFEKCKRTDKKEDFQFVATIPYYKNMSVNRLKSHMVLSKTIFDMIEKEKYDLLWVLVPHNSFVRNAAIYKKSHTDTKLVFDLIDLWPETFPMANIKALPPFRYWKCLRDRYLNAADEIVTECNLYHERLPKNINKSKVHTVYLAREVKEFNPELNLPEDKISLCYLGSINNIIDITVIYDLILDLKKYKPVVIHIVGDGESRQRLTDVCENAGAKVINYGKVYAQEEKQKIFNSCHYGLNIMKKSVFVGLTMKSIDYFEAGLPIINNIQGDTWNIIDREKVGINIGPSTDYESVINLACEYRAATRAFFENNLTVENFNSNIEKLFRGMR